MSSLQERIEDLRQDIVSDPPRISAYHDLPFAVFRYEPAEEFDCRKRMRLLAISLEQNHHRRVTFISLAELLWKSIRETEGVPAIIEEEREYGFDRAQRTVSTILSDPDFAPLAVELERRIKSLSPATDLVFLVRAAAFAPAIYHLSKLLDEMQGRTLVPIILWYPGRLEEGTNSALVYMSMHGREAIGNYRVRIY
jgi:hypothetical protein